MHTIACKIERVHYRYKKEEEEKWERIEQHVCNDSATAIVVHTTTTISACVRHSSHPRPHLSNFRVLQSTARSPQEPCATTPAHSSAGRTLAPAPLIGTS